jgi:mevalonate kinase
MITKITYSAPSKVHLSGEHSVVHGEPALIAAVDLRLHFSIWEAKKTPKIRDQKIRDISIVVKDYLKEKEIPFEDKNFEYEIISAIPKSVGLGSSASLAVAGSAAFLEFYAGKIFEAKEVNDCAYLVEKIFHGNPSGGDNSTVCFGGLIYFRKEFEFLKNINRLPFSIPQSMSGNFYLIDSGKRVESTADLVSYVQDGLNDNPALFKKLFRDIGKTTKTLVLGFKEDREKLVTDTISRNESFLEKLGVVSEVAEKIINELQPFGVGKISGAGGVSQGSGFILFYSPENKHVKLEKYLLDHKIPFIRFAPDNIGLKKEG